MFLIRYYYEEVIIIYLHHLILHQCQYCYKSVKLQSESNIAPDSYQKAFIIVCSNNRL